MRRSPHFLSIALLIGFSIIIYANALKNGFVFDDFGTIVNNNHLIKNPCKFSILINPKEYFDYSGEITYRPLATLSYMLDYSLYGLKPWGYHLTNILLHSVNVVLLYMFLVLLSAGNEQLIIKGRGVKLTTPQPFLLSLLFAAHPILTEAVNAVSFREDLLSFLFYMATLNIYLFLRADSNKCQPLLALLLYISSCLIYFLALLSKEMAASLPLVIYCYEWVYAYKGKYIFSFLLNWRYLGYLSITLIYIYLRFYYFYNLTEANILPPQLADRLATVPWLVLNYLKLTIFPVSLIADYKIGIVSFVYSIDFVLPFVVVLSLIALVFITKYREVAFGVVFYLITLIPVYNIVPIAHPFAERYLYLPMVGFIIVASFIINMILKTWRAYILLLIILIVLIYSFNVVKRNSVWIDSYSLWADTVKKMPNNNLAHYNLALVYYRQGRLIEAAQELDIAIRLKPDNAEQHFALAQVNEKQGRFMEALSEYEKAISIEPDDERYHAGIAILYFRQGMVERAIQEFETAYRLNPTEPKIYNNLKLAYDALKASQKQDLKKH